MIEIGEKGAGTHTYLSQHVLMLDPTAKVDAIPGASRSERMMLKRAIPPQSPGSRRKICSTLNPGNRRTGSAADVYRRISRRNSFPYC